jgi:hypothetical protein
MDTGTQHRGVHTLATITPIATLAPEAVPLSSRAATVAELGQLLLKLPDDVCRSAIAAALDEVAQRQLWQAN